MGFTDHINNLLVGEEARGNKEPLTSRFGNFNGSDVRQCDVSNIDVEKCTGGRNLLLHLTLDEVAHPLIRGIDGLQGIQIVDDGAKNQGRVDGSDVEIGLLLLNEIPGSLLGESLVESTDQLGRLRVHAEHRPTLLAR